MKHIESTTIITTTGRILHVRSFTSNNIITPITNCTNCSTKEEHHQQQQEAKQHYQQMNKFHHHAQHHHHNHHQQQQQQQEEFRLLVIPAEDASTAFNDRAML
jgi:hypothetical protein